jgi:PAS domain S-box-containing protein
VLKLLASQAAIALENTRLYRELRERDARIRRLVEANVIGIVIWNLDGRILEANDAFLRMVGYGRDDLVSGRVRWRELTPDPWRAADDQALAELAATGVCAPREKEYVRQDGRRVPVLVGAALFEGRRDEGVAFVLDLTARKRAEAEARESERRYREAQMELAHANRVATMGQLTASIAHEVSQPLAGIVSNGSACLRWLMRDSPNIEEARETARRIIRDGNRAGDVISRIRALVRKTDPEKTRLDINQAVREVINLTQNEAVGKGVVVRTELASGLLFVLGDRVQLQQVILNLIMNGVEAMSPVADRPRELLVYSRQHGADQVLVAVQDSGIGIDRQNLEKIFAPFYTTKFQGMGMGLAISRSIIENHGGKLWASSNDGPGTTFQFTLQACGKEE